jgi:SAM-dependent methyltransferase
VTATTLEQYNRIALIYDLIHPQFDLASDSVMMLLETLGLDPRRHRLLDCACGTGRQLAAIAGAGYEVVGADLSPGMIEVCQRNLADRGLNVSLNACSWRELPSHYGQEFDVILCCGNSIPHSQTKLDLELDIASMADVVASQGRVVIGLSDWAKIPVSTLTYWVQPSKKCGDSTVIPLYVWKSIDKNHKASIDIVIIHKGVTENRLEVYPLELVLYELQDISRAFECCGLTIERIIAAENPYHDQYVIASKSVTT